MNVEVRPIERKKWHGKTGNENFTQPTVLECLYDTSTGKYATGLSAADRKRLEAVTGYDLSDEYGDKPHPFWSTQIARVKLPARTTIFDTTKPLDEIKVKVLKASRFIANSMKEYEEGKYPDATHVIYDEAEEVKAKATKVQTKRKAYALATKLSNVGKVNIVQILGNKTVRDQSQDYVDVEIDKIIEKDVHAFLSFAKMDKAKVYVRASILEGLHRNILTKEGSAIYYMGDLLGHSIEEAMEYFLDPNNQSLKAAVLGKLIK